MRAGGKTMKRQQPGSWLWTRIWNSRVAEHLSRDSRPINGLSDPHWHVHCFVHNATFDPVENRWKAGQFRGLIADKGYFQEYFHTLLAQKLT